MLIFRNTPSEKTFNFLILIIGTKFLFSARKINKTFGNVNSTFRVNSITKKKIWHFYFPPFKKHKTNNLFYFQYRCYPLTDLDWKFGTKISSFRNDTGRTETERNRSIQVPEVEPLNYKGPRTNYVQDVYLTFMIPSPPLCKRL